MRHKYSTSGLVLSRSGVGEGSLIVNLLTPDLGLVRAVVQGVRKPSAKLASAIQTLCESDVMLVRGKEGWRLPNAVLATNWFSKLERPARLRAGRIASLLLRLVTGESADHELFSTYREFLSALTTLPEEEEDAAECLAALRIVRGLGFDDGELPGIGFESSALAPILADRRGFVTRINRGLAASGL